MTTHPESQGVAMTPHPESHVLNERDIFEVANQLEGYVDDTTPERLAAFLLREGNEAAKLAEEIVRLRALSASQEAAAPSEEPVAEAAGVLRNINLNATTTDDLIERLRGPVFGTQTALDAAAAIETWKARAERLADMHRDMCVVAGEAVARAETAEAALASRTAPVAVSVKDLQWRDLRGHSFPDMWCATTVCGVYDIEERSASDSPAYVALGPNYSFIANKDSLAEAKAAAQADFNARILSSILVVAK